MPTQRTSQSPGIEAASDATSSRKSGRRIADLIWAALPWLLVALGIVLRLQRFLLGRSFRNDEAALALAIQRPSLGALISKPLPGGLTAPVGFLALEKVITQALGYWDSVFRLLPLLAGMASVVLMLLLARRLLGKPGLIFALGAFAINWTLLFYSSDLKQYSSDVFFAVLLYLALALYLRASTRGNAILLAASGVLAIACSHPAIFVLASIVPVLLIHHYRDRNELRMAVGMAALWGLSFALLYFNYYRVVGQERAVVDYWNNLDGLMPVPPWENPNWFVIRTASFFTSVVGLSRWTLLNTLLFALGILSFTWNRAWQWSVVLLGSILLTLAASGAVNYPFKGRLILFLVPAALLAIGAGLDGLVTLLGARRWYILALGWLAALALLWAPARGALAAFEERRSTPYREDIKPVLAFVQQNWQADDFVVVYDQAAITYEFYAPFYGLADAETFYLQNDRNHPRRYRMVMDALPRPRRTWFIFSSVLDIPDETDVRTFLLDYAVQRGGQIVAQYNFDGVSFADLVLIR